MKLDRHPCRPRRPRACLPSLFWLFVILFAALPSTGFAQEHAPAQGRVEAPQHPPTASGAQAEPPHAAEEHADDHEEGGILPLLAKVANFAILVGVLVYFLKSPITAFLAARITAVKQDLATAKEMRAAAESQLAEIDRRLTALPAELEALRKQGAEDVRAEQARITQAAAAERERILEQTRREIDMRLRIARRELTAHVAELSVRVARERISRAITPEDQLRLVDRYVGQLKEAR